MRSLVSVTDALQLEQAVKTRKIPAAGQKKNIFNAREKVLRESGPSANASDKILGVQAKFSDPLFQRDTELTNKSSLPKEPLGQQSTLSIGHEMIRASGDAPADTSLLSPPAAQGKAQSRRNVYERPSVAPKTSTDDDDDAVSGEAGDLGGSNSIFRRENLTSSIDTSLHTAEKEPLSRSLHTQARAGDHDSRSTAPDAPSIDPKGKDHKPSRFKEDDPWAREMLLTLGEWMKEQASNEPVS